MLPGARFDKIDSLTGITVMHDSSLALWVFTHVLQTPTRSGCQAEQLGNVIGVLPVKEANSAAVDDLDAVRLRSA